MVEVDMDSRQRRTNILMTALDNVHNENRENEMRFAAETEAEGHAETDEAVQMTEADAEANVEAIAVAVAEECEESKTIPEAESVSGSVAQGDITAEAEKATVTTEETDYNEHVRYNALGVAIYTDPRTKEQFQFADDEWIPATDANRLDSDAATTDGDPYETEHYIWCHETKQWIAKATKAYWYDAARQQWIPKAGTHTVTSTPKSADSDELVHTYTDKDGAVFFWDAAKTAWFPQIDDDFMAKYQMGYGNYERSDSEEEDEVELLEKLLASKQVKVDDGVVAGSDSVTATEEKATATKRKAPQQPASECTQRNTHHYTRHYTRRICRMV